MEWLGPLLRPDAERALRHERRGVLTALPRGDGATAGRFEGLYGGLYDRVIQSDSLRRFASLAYGPAGPVVHLDAFVGRVVDGTASAARGRTPVLLDVPAGGGTLLPRIAEAGYRGHVIASDLGTAMLRRAADQRDRSGLDVALLRADAQDLPLRDASVDAAVSLNGLHVLPEPHRFLRELGRVIRPGGRLFLITLVTGGTRRGDLVIGAGSLAGILPGPPPPRAALLRLVHEAGFRHVEELGGAALTGLAAVRA